MKKIVNKYKLILLTMLVVLFMSTTLTGCSELEALTTEEFMSICEEYGYTVIENSKKYINLEDLKESWTASTTDGSMEIEFNILENNEAAIDMYEETKTKIENTKGFKSASATINTPNHQSYTTIIKKNFKFVGRINETVIYINTPISEKEIAELLISEFGY